MSAEYGRGCWGSWADWGHDIGAGSDLFTAVAWSSHQVPVASFADSSWSRTELSFVWVMVYPVSKLDVLDMKAFATWLMDDPFLRTECC